MTPRHTQAFGRRIATDKFIQLFFILNFGCLIGIIVWYAIKKGKIKPPKINIPPLPTVGEIFGGGSSSAPSTEPVTPASADGGAEPAADGGATPAEVTQRFLRGAF